MAGATLAEARTAVADFLDDPNNRRWTTTQIDASLKVALSRCMSDYASAGGRLFDEEVSGTSSATDGTVDLTSYGPIVVREVSILSGNRYDPVEPSRKIDREILDAVARTVKVRITRDWQLPTTTTHQLVGNGATAAKAWAAFDDWICATAALRCAVKDDDRRPGIADMEARLRASVLDRANPARSRPLPLPRMQGAVAWALVWSYDAQTQMLQLARERGVW